MVGNGRSRVTIIRSDGKENGRRIRTKCVGETPRAEKILETYADQLTDDALDLAPGGMLGGMSVRVSELDVECTLPVRCRVAPPHQSQFNRDIEK